MSCNFLNIPLLVICCFVFASSHATLYYTASSAATINGNTSSSANWTTNTDGITGLSNVVLGTNDELHLLSNAFVSILNNAIVNQIMLRGDAVVTGSGKSLQLYFGINIQAATAVLTIATGVEIIMGTGTAGSTGQIDNNSANANPFSNTKCINASQAKFTFVQGSAGNNIVIAPNTFYNNQIHTLKLNHFTTANSLQVGNLITITNSLELVKGNIYSSSLTIDADANIIGGHYTSSTDFAFITGRLFRNTNAAASYTFPMGSMSAVVPTTITTTSASPSQFMVDYGYYNNEDFATLCNPARINTWSRNYNWEIIRISGIANASITLPYLANISPNWKNGFNPGAQDKIIALHKEVGTNCWKDEGGTFLDGTATSGFVTTGVLSNFSPFTIGYGPASVLPVKILSFAGKQQTHYNLLQWQVAEQQNIKQYTVQYHTGSGQFAAIQTTTATNTNKYEAEVPLVNGIAYYRLHIEEQNGGFTYSNVVTIKNNKTSNSILYNDALQSASVYLSGTLQVLNMQGAVVQKASVTTGSIVSLNLLSAAVYVLQLVANDGSKKSIQIVKR